MSSERLAILSANARDAATHARRNAQNPMVWEEDEVELEAARNGEGIADGPSRGGGEHPKFTREGLERLRRRMLGNDYAAKELKLTTEQMVGLYADGAGMSMTEIAKLAGCTRMTVWRRVMKRKGK